MDVLVKQRSKVRTKMARILRVEPWLRNYCQAQFVIYVTAVLVQLARCVFYAIYTTLQDLLEYLVHIRKHVQQYCCKMPCGVIRVRHQRIRVLLPFQLALGSIG